MFFTVTLYISLIIFGVGLIYKISSWFRYRVGEQAREIPPLQRVSAAFKGIILTLFSLKIFILFKVFIMDVLLQVRILRENPLRWVMHMCIYGGFMLLLLMHALDKFIIAPLFPDYAATLNPFLFLRNLFFVVVITGLGTSLYRRFVLKVSRLNTNVMDHYAIIILAVIMLSGVFLEGTKIVSYSRYQSMVEEYADTDDEKELKTLGGLLEEPAHPFGGIVGGAKVSDKVGMLENILAKVDFLLIGGGMAATFLKAQSYEVGESLIEDDLLETAASLVEKAVHNDVHLLLPVDVIVADEVDAKAKGRSVPISNISPEESIVDIGPQTIKNFYEELRKCRTVFWNGPMGICEIAQFAEGTRGIVKLMANLDATTIIGGGSTAEIVTNMGLADKMSFISTGGGASLMFLGGQTLPGVDVLLDKNALLTGKVKGLVPAT